ncbi:MAG: hypothetical protein AAGJ93_17950, partial [Bacteroidota bacterium]
IVPRKISSEASVFENYGSLLNQFFLFIDEQQYISNAQKLIKTVEKIKHQIPQKANDPDNWGMAKTMMMNAYNQGVDVTDEEALRQFMFAQQVRGLDQINNEYRVARTQEDPFKQLGRNQKISVKYSDGRVLENIKFKKVESDLRNGLCELLS